MAMAVVCDTGSLSADLVAALEDTRQSVRICSRCGAVTTAQADPCSLCTSSTRDGTQICVVEDPGDITVIERSGGYEGRYHALMGRLSPMKGSGPAELRVQALVGRVKSEGIKEVILALSTDVEGDATCAYLAELLAPQGVRLTRLAFGLPAGSGIAYSDSVTLARAMRGRSQA